MSNICFISKYNQYETKLHFAKMLSAALRRLGNEVFECDADEFSKNIAHNLKSNQIDYVISLNRSMPGPNGEMWWDSYSIPTLTMLVDPAYYARDYFKSQQAILTCVDRQDVEFVKDQEFSAVSFLPHAVEADLFQKAPAEKEYEVVLMGSCYDPEGYRSLWQKKLAPELCHIIEEAIASVNSTQTPFYEATLQSALERGVDEATMVKHDLPYYVDHYVRGDDRLRLIQSIRDVPIHVFGGTCVTLGNSVKGWGYYLRNQKNVVFHPSLPFTEAIDVLRKAKICLNSVPSFPDGTHERVFYSLAANCLPMTSESRFLREEFGDSIGFYNMQTLPDVNDWIVQMLNDESLRQSKLEAARVVAQSRHTWDNRAATIQKLIEICS